MGQHGGPTIWKHGGRTAGRGDQLRFAIAYSMADKLNYKIVRSRFIFKTNIFLCPIFKFLFIID